VLTCQSKKIFSFQKIIQNPKVISPFFFCISLSFLFRSFSLTHTLDSCMDLFLSVFYSHIHDHRDQQEKGNNFSFPFVFVLLPFLRSIFFSIIFVFGGYFFLRATYFCYIFLFDECFAYRSTFVI